MTDDATERIVADVTPDAHRHVDATGTVSFKLACGCTVPPSEPGSAYLFKKAGCEYECSRHGNQVIVRATTRLTGWKDPR